MLQDPENKLRGAQNDKLFDIVSNMRMYFVYIMASGKNGTLYIGVTNDLEKRAYEHKQHMVKGFTNQYNITNLVYYEQTDDIWSALEREKKLKNRHRAYKIKLIEKTNPGWRDLYNEQF